jgi:tetratricopeptide (TPR) repeat protein
MDDALWHATSPDQAIEAMKSLVRSRLGVEPEAQLGTNARFWTFLDGTREVRFTVVAQGVNTALNVAGAGWLLRIEEPPPASFAAEVAAWFRPSAGVARNMGRTIRTQFKSADRAVPGPPAGPAPGLPRSVSVTQSVDVSESVNATHSVAFTEAEAPRLQPGARWQVGDLILGLYRVQAIRSGAMGVVYLCGGEDGIGEAAIKTILADPLADDRARQQMRSEAEAWLALGPHPNVVQCTFLIEGPYDKRLLLFLDRVHGHPRRGITLTEWMEGGLLDPPTAGRVAAGIAKGMQFAWETAGLVHRDLKPDNVLMAADGTPMVSDFGLALPVRDGATATGAAGTPAYMAPEIWRGHTAASVKTDVYSFGAILWEVLAGVHPFADHFDSLSSLRHAHASFMPGDPRIRNPAAPGPLARLALACLAKSPSARPADFGAVLDVLRREVGPFPDVAPAFKDSELTRAQGLMNLGRWGAAETVVEAAGRARPGDVRVDLLRLRVLEHRGDWRQDPELVERIVALEATDGVILRARSRALRLRGRPEGALAVVDQNLAIEPGAGDLLHDRGQLLWELGRHEEALAALAAANRFNAQVDRARLLFSLDRPGEGFACLQRALEMNPSDVTALLHMSTELEDRGHLEQALSHAEKAARTEPASMPARRMRARLLGRVGRVAESLAALRALAAERPEEVEVWSDLMSALGKDAAPGEIEACAVRMLEGRATTKRGHLAKGSIEALNGRHADAIRSFDRALDVDPKLALAWQWKGNAWLELGGAEQAVDAYRRALALEPGNQEVVAALAAVQAGLARPEDADAEPGREAAWRFSREANRALQDHRLEDAEALYRRALQADPGDPTHAAALASCLFILAKQRPDALAEALELFGTAEPRRPDDPIILFNHASALVRAGRAVEAAARVRRLRQLTPDDPDLERLEQDVRDALAEASPAFGQARQLGGPRLQADGLLVEPALGAYAVLDGMDQNLPGPALQPLVDAMASFIDQARSEATISWPFAFDTELSLEANVLLTALRRADGLSVSSGPRTGWDVAAALVTGNRVEVAFTGDARCLLVRGGVTYRLGEPSEAMFEVRGHDLQPGDVIVLASRSTVQDLVTGACGGGATPRSVALRLARATGARVVVIRHD